VTTSEPVVIPSISATGPIEIGMLVVANSAALTQACGCAAFDTGDQKAQGKALEAYVNAHGGINGRPVKVVFATLDATSTQPYASFYEQQCTTWTQDNHVAAAISVGQGLSSDALPACLGRRGVALAAWTKGGISQRMLQKWPLFTAPTYMSMDRTYRALVERLSARGYFKTGKVGLLRFDTSDYEQVAAKVIKPQLAKHGVTLAAEQAFAMPESTADLSRMASQVQGAIVAFRAAGVDHVLMEDLNGAIALQWMTVAEQQGYRPTYGLTSDSIPDYMAATIPGQQMVGAMGIGFSPSPSGVDTSGDRNPMRSSAATKQCLDILKKAGQDMSQGSVQETALLGCDAFFFVVQALRLGGADGFRAGLAKIGSSFQPATTGATAFDLVRRDGPAFVRDNAFDSACSCWRYVGGNQLAP
jgi:ABC-type branched-subunit amino acid transport system substrate-binding protein